MISRFKVIAVLDGAGGAQQGTVEIDRVTNIMSVRVKRKHRRYEMPLSTIASWICRTILLAEAAERRRAKRAKKRG